MYIVANLNLLQCVKSARIWSFFWSVFSCIWTEYLPEKLRIRTLFSQCWLIFTLALLMKATLTNYNLGNVSCETHNMELNIWQRERRHYHNGCGAHACVDSLSMLRFSSNGLNTKLEIFTSSQNFNMAQGSSTPKQ